MNLRENVCLAIVFCVTVQNLVFAAHKQHKKQLHDNIRVSSAKLTKRVGNSDNLQQPRVQLENGATIIGRVNRTVDLNKIYYSFRGIPFAQPPVGNLRFRAPVPLSRSFSKKTVHAFEDASPCVQSGAIPTTIIGSEDCLYINVYTPQPPGQNASLLPVMVWIYGGAFINGSSVYSSFGPDYFIDEGNVMIVSFNYRLGIFGFLSTEDNASPGNYGLKDQILALKWVQENIRSFGGDPNQVTIFGESAGAASVSYLTQTPLTNGLFHRAIFESGTTLSLWALTRNSRVIALTTAYVLKINITNSQTLVDALRRVDYRKLQVVATVTDYGNILLRNPLNGLFFSPTMEPDAPGAVVVNKSHEQLSNGLFHHVPYIIGFNSLEAIPFVDMINYVRWYLLKYDLGPTSLVPTSMNINNFFVEFQVNSEIKSYYFGLTPVTVSNEKLLQFISDDEFNRPLTEDTRLRSQKTPVYMYKFSYQGPLGSGNRTLRGVGHGEELAYLWRQSSNNANATQSDILTRKRMIKLWTNFAITGNPTPENDPLLQNVKWPLANTAGSNNLAYLDIDRNLTSNINPFWNNFKFWQYLFRQYGNPPYCTY